MQQAQTLSLGSKVHAHREAHTNSAKSCNPLPYREGNSHVVIAGSLSEAQTPHREFLGCLCHGTIPMCCFDSQCRGLDPPAVPWISWTALHTEVSLSVSSHPTLLISRGWLSSATPSTHNLFFPWYPQYPPAPAPLRSFSSPSF